MAFIVDDGMAMVWEGEKGAMLCNDGIGYGFFGRAVGAGRIQARDLVQSCNAEKVYAMFVYFFAFVTKHD